MVAVVPWPYISSSARSARSSDGDRRRRRRRRRPHSKDSSFLGLPKAALRFFKFSNFACNAGTGAEAADDDVGADAGKKLDAARRKWRFLRPRVESDGGSAASRAGGSGEVARPTDRVKPDFGEENPSDGEEANAVGKKSRETLLDMLLSEEEACARGSTIPKSASDKFTSFSQFLISDDGPEAPFCVTGNASNSKHGAGEASFKGHDAGGRFLMDHPGKKEEYGEEDEVFDTGKKPVGARSQWPFPKPSADEGSDASQTGGSGELARPENHVEPELGEKRPSDGEEANAVDEWSKETLFDVLVGEEEDRVGGSTIRQSDVVGSDEIMNCTSSQFLTIDDGPVELHTEASDHVKNFSGEASFKAHDAGGRFLVDQQGQKEEFGDEEKREEEVEEFDGRCSDTVMLSAGSKRIEAQGRSPGTKSNTLSLLWELARRVPADNPVSTYVGKMKCAIGSVRDLFRPVLFGVKLKKELLVVLAASHASVVTPKIGKSLKYETGAPAPQQEQEQEVWKKEIIMGRRCKKRDRDGFSARWSNAGDLPAIVDAEETLGMSFSLRELAESSAAKFRT